MVMMSGDCAVSLDVPPFCMVNERNRIGGLNGHLPWRLTFSYGRALQAAPQKAWSGKSENIVVAQRAFSHRAMMNGLAALGQWKQELSTLFNIETREGAVQRGAFDGPGDGGTRDR